MTGAFSLAVHALVFLNHKGTSQTSEALAENICTNPARVRKVMAPLKRAGLIATKEGFEGGYTFVGEAAQVTLRQVAEAVETQFVKPTWRSGDEDMDCLVASGMARIMDGIYSGLDRRCLEEMERLTLEDIDRQIFNGQTSGK